MPYAPFARTTSLPPSRGTHVVSTDSTTNVPLPCCSTVVYLGENRGGWPPRRQGEMTERETVRIARSKGTKFLSVKRERVHFVKHLDGWGPGGGHAFVCVCVCVCVFVCVCVSACVRALEAVFAGCEGMECVTYSGEDTPAMSSSFERMSLIVCTNSISREPRSRSIACLVVIDTWKSRKRKEKCGGRRRGLDGMVGQSKGLFKEKRVEATKGKGGIAEGSHGGGVGAAIVVQRLRCGGGGSCGSKV